MNTRKCKRELKTEMQMTLYAHVTYARDANQIFSFSPQNYSTHCYVSLDSYLQFSKSFKDLLTDRKESHFLRSSYLL